MPDPRTIHPSTGPAREPVGRDSLALADSLDIRFLVAGKLSPAAIPLRHDRAELAEVLGRERK
jgi:hypothetical protein